MCQNTNMKNFLKIFFLALIITSCKQAKEQHLEKSTISQKDDTSLSDTIQVKKEKIPQNIIPQKTKISNYETIIKPEISESDYVDFLNEVLEKEGLVINENIKILSLEPSSFIDNDLKRLTMKSKDTVLSKIINRNDIIFFYEQAKLQKNVKLNPSKIDRKKIEQLQIDELSIQNDDLEKYWSEIYKIGKGYYSLDLPLFSLDKKVAVFYCSYSCGSLCADSGIYVFKKINGKWIKVTHIGSILMS